MVYILVLNWNNWEASRDCLDALLKLDFPDCRLVVLDNGSSDGPEEKFREWAMGAGAGFVSYTRQEALAGGRPEEEDAKKKKTSGKRPLLVFIQNGENLGYPGGNNVGLRYGLARGDFEYAWLLNNDTLPEAGALQALVSCARQTGAAMAGSKLLYAHETETLQMAGGGMIWPAAGNAFIVASGQKDDGQWDKPFPLDYICGASLLVRKEVLCRVGFLDERYFLYWEDADWGVRARRAGFRLVYCPSSRVVHKEGATISKETGSKEGNKEAVSGISGKADYYWVRNGLYFTKKYYPWFLPLVPLAYLAKHTIVRLLKRQPCNLKYFLLGFLDFISGRTGRRNF